ncbi:TPA: YolD-like family protein [Staphylococcus aureus]|uniref:YolD-like family protein n=1 Tax=Staphylococcus TaxID=1279 RepID=UPI0005C48F87|nr:MULTISPECIES: YolD-like family protein [Staphylococcus]MBE5677230.1 YolD-like family protein [Staphylococcus singaporensis]HCX0627716.1 YolD-like family protein [Staphylococcus aureus]HDA4896536.1 YolD-like family protein [Staphylococcus aureus]HDA5091074.1 YolD-like family protein [Staphylococcus aureus]HDE0265556.1 YolD-like family protein [Staphylococcus aureus]
MIKESRAKVLPKEYKNETDYRKIPREYLESNIPQGRGSVKWQPFATIPEQYEMLRQYAQDQNRQDRPSLFNEQKTLINDVIQQKIYTHEQATVYYWDNGYNQEITKYIIKVDVMSNILTLGDKNGSNLKDIPLQNIKSID